ncbi:MULTISPECIES: hypothetical protein [Flavobacterium]|uniref:Uncharacterized protein n=1 Tax=Flavobacterium jumunjinense TaxID=998845 RepID=A0ABV5GPI2_9FLAO|nr:MULTISPECIES: hypothetical protein [Flavobacterium]
MTGKLTVAIKGGLRKSAKEVLEHTDDLKKTAKNAEEAKQIDEVIEHLEDVAGETNELYRRIEELFDLSPFIRKFTKITSKQNDNVSKIVKEAEKNILKQASLIQDSSKQFEYAFVWHPKKFLNPKIFTSNSNEYVRLSEAFGTSGNLTKKQRYLLKGSVFTHNHPNFSRFSNEDIKVFLQFQLKELRAITSEGIVYSLKMKSNVNNFAKSEISLLYKNLEKAKSDFVTKKLLNARSFDKKNKIYFELQDFEEEFILKEIKNKIDYKIFK